MESDPSLSRPADFCLQYFAFDTMNSHYSICSKVKKFNNVVINFLIRPVPSCKENDSITMCLNVCIASRIQAKT